jgi:hypothetical protein
MTLRPTLRASYLALLGALGLLPIAACDGGVETPAYPCSDSQPVLQEGQETGFETCSEGYQHRTTAVTCPSILPRTEACESGWPEGDTCSTDADCTDQANGYCTAADNFGGGNCSCSYGCETDSDCGAGNICVCGGIVGHCAKADCATDADCPGDNLCTTYVTEPGCGSTAYACQTAEDECASDADCGPNEQCTLGSGGVRECADIACAIGRPFLVEGLERLAEPVARGDWADEVELMCDDIAAADRRALASHWTNVGLMEHASIAAFARFAMQLMAQGAPAELVELCTDAMRDETAHARVAFAFASAYADAPVGPSELSIDNALDDDDALTVLALVIREGCIGETVAAVEAAVAARHAIDPTVRAALEQIARDEHRHAELAWKYVDWFLASAGETARATLLAEIESAAIEATAPYTVREGDGRLLEHGAVGESMRRRIRREAIAEVVSPCALRLAGKHRHEARKSA